LGWVYLIGQRDDPNKFKVGVTKGCVDKRLKKLQTGNAEELYAYKTFETDTPFTLEKMLHRHFFGKGMVGEWFYMNEDDIKKFLDTCKMYQESINSLKENPFFKAH
jgi:hypothetical protein